MSIALITPRRLSGTITAPPSKSDAHRAIICAALSGGICEIHPIALSHDVTATINAMCALGAKIQILGDRLLIDGTHMFTISRTDINCNESASTLRFLIPILATAGINARLIGSQTLGHRPLQPYLDCLASHGAIFSHQNTLPLDISGTLLPGEFFIPANISSQFISGLLLALPLLKSDSQIHLSTQLESASYIDMTIDTMNRFGVTVEKTDYGYKISGNQRYLRTDYTIEGDWSQAAFYLAAGVLGENIKVSGLKSTSLQADRAIFDLLVRFGGELSYVPDGVMASQGKLHGTNIYASQIPDLVPILSVVAALSEGTTHIMGASRLRLKESNRLEAIQQALSSLGANIQELEDGLIIEGTSALGKANVCGQGDHRIVMALCIAATRAADKVSINDANSISKSYPSFFEDYDKLGGMVNIIGMG